LLTRWDIHLGVNGRSRYTDTLRPGEVEEVSESAEEPDAPLVPSHTQVVQFYVDQSGFSLEDCHGSVCRAFEDRSERQVGVLDDWDVLEAPRIFLVGTDELVVDGLLDCSAVIWKHWLLSVKVWSHSATLREVREKRRRKREKEDLSAQVT